jgi:hypothetical protein
MQNKPRRQKVQKAIGKYRGKNTFAFQLWFLREAFKNQLFGAVEFECRTVAPGRESEEGQDVLRMMTESMFFLIDPLTRRSFSLSPIVGRVNGSRLTMITHFSNSSGSQDAACV